MGIHPTAIVDSRAEIDPTVEVGPYCIIEEHVRIDAGCRLMHGVFVTGWTTIGENCTLHPGAIIGHSAQDVKYKGERTYCRIGRNNIIREYVTIHRATEPETATIIGDDCFFLAGSHVAHNCRVGSHVTLINDVLLGGHVQVGDRAMLGGRAGIHQFTRIGELAMVAATAKVVQDVLPYAMVATDGRIAGLNRIGLRRAGLSREEIDEIKRMYRTLFARGASFGRAKELVGSLASTEPGRRLVQFLQADSRRGFAGRTRSGRELGSAEKNGE